MVTNETLNAQVPQSHTTNMVVIIKYGGKVK